MHDPKILIMDEPAAGLDPRARVELRELLKVLSEQGKAVILSSHILTELAEICTNVVIIEQGKLLRAGELEELAKEKSLYTPLLIRSMGSRDELLKDLLQLPYVVDAKILSDFVAVELEGGDAECHSLLELLLQRNHRIVEFHQEKTKLEDLFMTITEGQVQ